MSSVDLTTEAELTISSPYVAQGAAQAVEDAAALGVLLSLITSPDEIPQALRAYERSRKERAETVQQSGSDNRITLHLSDGLEQQARDAQFRAAASDGSNPDRWSDRETQRFLWGWDAEEDALNVWNGTSEFLILFNTLLQAVFSCFQLADLSIELHGDRRQPSGRL